MTEDNVLSLGRLRSMLFVPAVRPDLIAKVATNKADAVVLDLEDSTPASEKVAARSTVREAIAALAAARRNVLVRVNPQPTEWFEEDVRDALVVGVSAIVLPKVELTQHLDAAGRALDARGLADVGCVVGIETVRGVMDARSLLAHPRVVAAYFGAEDYIADLGGVRALDNREVVVPRATVAMAARLSGVPVLDIVVTQFRDDGRFAHESREARELGYSGKLCIHPSQVTLANELFAPTDEEIDRARRVLEAFDEGVARGRAAVAFEGQMIDEPLARQMRNLLGQTPTSNGR